MRADQTMVHAYVFASSTKVFDYAVPRMELGKIFKIVRSFFCESFVIMLSGRLDKDSNCTKLIYLKIVIVCDANNLQKEFCYTQFPGFPTLDFSNLTLLKVQTPDVWREKLKTT